MTRWLAALMRRWADRIDRQGAPGPPRWPGRGILGARWRWDGTTYMLAEFSMSCEGVTLQYREKRAFMEANYYQPPRDRKWRWPWRREGITP